MALWAFSLPATLAAAYLLKLPFLLCYIVMFVFEDYVKVLLCYRKYKTNAWIKPVTPEGREGLREFNGEKI